MDRLHNAQLSDLCFDLLPLLYTEFPVYIPFSILMILERILLVCLWRIWQRNPETASPSNPRNGNALNPNQIPCAVIIRHWLPVRIDAPVNFQICVKTTSKWRWWRIIVKLTVWKRIKPWGAYSFKPSAGIAEKCTQNLLQISPIYVSTPNSLLLLHTKCTYP